MADVTTMPPLPSAGEMPWDESLNKYLKALSSKGTQTDPLDLNSLITRAHAGSFCVRNQWISNGPPLAENGLWIVETLYHETNSILQRLTCGTGFDANIGRMWWRITIGNGIWGEWQTSPTNLKVSTFPGERIPEFGALCVVSEDCVETAFEVDPSSIGFAPFYDLDTLKWNSSSKTLDVNLLNSRGGLEWSRFNGCTDVEAWACLEPNYNSNPNGLYGTGIALRISGDTSTRTFVCAALRKIDTSWFLIVYQIKNTALTLFQDLPILRPEGKLNIQLRVQGADVYAGVWNSGRNAPRLRKVGTTTVVDPGRVGLYARGVPATIFNFGASVL